MSFEQLFAWWNAVYSVPLIVVLTVATVTALVSLIGGGFGDATDAVDADADADLDVDADLDADAGLDAHGDHGHGHPHTSDAGLLLPVLAAIGVGRAPLMLVLQVFCLLWGLVGLTLHSAAPQAGAGALLWSLPISLVAAAVGTRLFSGLVARVMPQSESSVVKRDQLVGRIGKVVYPVSLEEGTINVRDAHGTLHRVRARTQQGRLDSGEEVIILGFDPQRNLYEVDDSREFIHRD
ncbi:MAG: hypothetical protein ACK47B_10115 [Armatimonadota bacterium]